LIAVVLLAAIVLLGPFGGRGPDDVSPEYLQGQATIETVFESDDTGSFTANAIAICPDGDVTRLRSGATATGSWREDAYRCGSGTFIIRTELPQVPGAGSSEPAVGTWSILSGTDDYTELAGEGTVAWISHPNLTQSLTGVIDSGY